VKSFYFNSFTFLSIILYFRSCGVSFSVWEKKNADGKPSGSYDWTSLMGTEKKILLQKLPDKLAQCLKPSTCDVIIKLWKDFFALYKFLNEWRPDISPGDFWSKAKDWINMFTSLAGKREGYERSRVTPYMHIMVAHVPWFLSMYQNVKVFTGQGVEKNNDVARSIVLRKSQHFDSPGDILRHEARQWALKETERNPRKYQKHKAAYWENTIFEKRARKQETLRSSDCLSHSESPQPTVTNTELNIQSDLQEMTVAQLKDELKQRNVKGYSKKTKQELITLLKKYR